MAHSNINRRFAAGPAGAGTRLLAALAVSGLLLAACSTSPAPETPADEGFRSWLEGAVPELLDQALTPGVGVALIEKGELAWVQGWGHADVAADRPVEADTGFNIGSISKTVAAWGVMKLVEEGRLDLDTPVSQYLTRWQLPPSEEFDADGVTIRRLLSHTAGLSLHGYPGFGPDAELPSVEESLSGATNGSGDVHLMLAPGTEFDYSGGGYTLCQLLVEEVTGESFQDYLRATVLRPLGMERSDYELTSEILAGSATAYDNWGDITPNPRFTAQAAAGLHTTTRDLATFALAALAGPAGEVPGRGILAPETIAEMIVPAPASGDNYGLGYSVAEGPGGRQVVGHGGANRGWQSVFWIEPESGDGLVVVTNGSNGRWVVSQIENAWFSHPSGDAAPPKLSSQLAVIRAFKGGTGAEAVARYRELRENAADEVDFAEFHLNNVGYALLGRDRLDDAIEIFKLNVEMYPEAANPYDSLGEAYFEQGDLDLSEVNYRKSLELDPENTNAEEFLARIAERR
ncbi:MAG: serine hydrolase [Acidobacteriota bacterium]